MLKKELMFFFNLVEGELEKKRLKYLVVRFLGIFVWKG